MKLFTYWRSQAAFRVRIALRLKGLAMEKVSLDLLKGDQFAADYQKLNPEGVVPTLIDGEGSRSCSRSRSSNISTRNIPSRRCCRATCARGRMRARSPRWWRWMRIRSSCRACASISRKSCISTRRRAGNGCGTGSTPAAARSRRCWRAIRAPGKFCVGDQVTIADICLAAHLTSAKLFGGRDPADYPAAGRIYANCMQIEAFAAEHPLRQPDAPQS